MPLSCFYRIARNTMMMCFGSQTDSPSTETIEREFWNHVSTRKAHICVHSGSIDSGPHGYGFSIAKNSAFRKHPWNLKVLTNNSASILRFLGPLMGELKTLYFIFSFRDKVRYERKSLERLLSLYPGLWGR